MIQLSPKECEKLFLQRAARTAANIDYYIKRSKLNNLEVAFFTDTSPTTIHYARHGMYHGKAFIPEIHTIEKICIILGISISDILKQPDNER